MKLTTSERIVLKAAYEIGQVERGVSVIASSRRQHWRTIDSLEKKGYLYYINHTSALLTEKGFIIAASLSDASASLLVEVNTEYSTDYA